MTIEEFRARVIQDLREEADSQFYQYVSRDKDEDTIHLKLSESLKNLADRLEGD